MNSKTHGVSPRTRSASLSSASSLISLASFYSVPRRNYHSSMSRSSAVIRQSLWASQPCSSWKPCLKTLTRHKHQYGATSAPDLRKELSGSRTGSKLRDTLPALSRPNQLRQSSMPCGCKCSSWMTAQRLQDVICKLRQTRWSTLEWSCKEASLWNGTNSWRRASSMNEH